MPAPTQNRTGPPHHRILTHLQHVNEKQNTVLTHCSTTIKKKAPRRAFFLLFSSKRKKISIKNLTSIRRIVTLFRSEPPPPCASNYQVIPCSFFSISICILFFVKSCSDCVISRVSNFMLGGGCGF